MVYHFRNIYINHIYVFSWHIKHARNKVWSGANEIILKTGMLYGFEEMCDFHKAIVALLHFLFMQ